ncbi:hypothetical protein L7F22_061131 [Adiantum nelumboides]|nr:hypothetical protein [Adiantum nelumboides]
MATIFACYSASSSSPGRTDVYAVIYSIVLDDSWLETAELVSFRFRIGYWLVGLVTAVEVQVCLWFRISRSGSLVSFRTGLLSRFVSGSDPGLVSLWSGSLVSFRTGLLFGSGFGLVSAAIGLVTGQCSAGSGPSAGTQGSATQDPHIAASDSSSGFDIMEGYPMQQHPESSSQDMHALGQQPGISMFSRLKETLSRATRSEHATNEINEGGGEVDSPFTSQIDPVLSESAHVSTPATTPIGLSKLTPSETLLPDGRSLAEVQEVERYIFTAREKEIESLRKAEQRRATLAKAPMASTNPLQSLELTTLTSQPIGSHIASGSKDTPNTSILDGVFLNENWEYNLQTEKLTDLYTSYTYHVLLLCSHYSALDSSDGTGASFGNSSIATLELLVIALINTGITTPELLVIALTDTGFGYFASGVAGLSGSGHCAAKGPYFPHL